MSTGQVQVEIVASLGQFQAQMKAAAESLGQIARASKELGASSGQGFSEHSKSSGEASKATQGLVGSMRDYQKEQRTQGRMSKFWAGELLEMVPAAESAKGAIQGLIGIGVEGLMGVLGIGLAIEGAKLLALVITSIGEEERKANAEAVKFAESLGKQTAEVWKNVEALQARRQNIPEFEVEARQQLNSPRENLGGVSLLEKQVSLRAQLAKLDADFNANWKGKGAFDDAGHGWEQAIIAHKREELLLQQQLTQVTQAIIPIEAARYEKSLVWAKEFNASQEKTVQAVEADARRIGAMGGTERERIEVDRTNKKIDLERQYQEEKAKGTANDFAHSQALANIDNEADARLRKLTQATESQNAVLRGQVAALEALDDVEKAVVAWQTERDRVQRSLAQSAIEASTATLQLRLADEQYLVSLKKINAEEDKRRLDSAQARGLQDALMDPGEAGGLDVSKSPSDVHAQAGKNAERALAKFNQTQAEAIQLSAQWGQTLGNALGGLITGTMSLGQVFAQVAQQIVANLVQIAIQAVTANAASAGAGAASSQAGIPIVGPVLAIAAMGAMVGAVLGLLGNIGAKEMGGGVYPGGAYLVGERGPEILRVGLAGAVVPNHQLGTAGAQGGWRGSFGGGANITIHATDADSFEKMLRRNDNALVRVLREAQRSGRG